MVSDEQYYGDYGKQFLSNSDIGSLLKHPQNFRKPTSSTPALIIGGYFHTLVLEPDKVDRYKIIDASTRNTKLYKELSDGEMCLLQKEADIIEALRDKLMGNNTVRGLITGNVEYEQPQIAEIAGEWWKGKADIINHDEKLIIDLKTTSDLNKFRSSARNYNYNSQAYIYQTLFGYDMVFIAIDKNTKNIGIYDCSTDFISRGEQKVMDAVLAYRTFHKDVDFDFNQHFINETL